MVQSGGRLTRLDGLRGVAAVGVAVYHAAEWPNLAAAFPGPLGWVFHWGWTLVDLFFVLSGYVFAHVYAGPGRLQGRGAAGDFWVARLARLWPLHLVMLALFVIFAWGGNNNMGTLLWHLFLAQGFYLPSMLAFNSVSWSISIEMVCYMLFFLAARRGARAFAVMTLLIVVGSAGWLLGLGHQDGPWANAFMPRGWLGFFLGQMLWRGREILVRVPTWLLMLSAATGLWLESSPSINPIVPLTVLTWSAAVLMALRLPLLDLPVIAWLGQRSFGIYMVHMAVIQAIDGHWPPESLGPVAFAVEQIIVAAATLVAADLAWRLIEAPSRRAIRTAWRRRTSPECSVGLPV